MTMRGKLALVTGAASGIGKATCQVLSREGVTVIAADRNRTCAEKTVQSLEGIGHSWLELDVSKESSVEKMLTTLRKKTPELVVNCAGITRDSFLLDMSTDAFQEVLDVNLKGSFLVTQGVCRALVAAQSTGSIVNIASIVGQTGNLGQANYSASKAAVEAFTKTVAREMGKYAHNTRSWTWKYGLRKINVYLTAQSTPIFSLCSSQDLIYWYGIRCNAVVPGFIESPMTDAVPDKVKQMFVSRIPLSRLGKPQGIL